MTETLEIAVLSMHERSEDLVSAEMMCRHAADTKLFLLERKHLELLSRQRASICVVPYIGGETVELALLETFPDRVNIRPMEASFTSGWSPKYPWLFKR